MTNVYLTSAAAEYVHDRIAGHTVNYWSQRLINMRRKDRPQTYQMPFTMLSGAATYEQADLDNFVEFEKARRLEGKSLKGRAAEVVRAFGIGEPAGSTQGRVLKHAAANLHLMPGAAQDVAVQMIIGNPLAAWLMTAEQAIALGKELTDAGLRAARFKQETEAGV